MKQTTRILLLIILFFVLILIRAFASTLFYDPFIAYFKNDYLHKSLPQINTFKFLINIFYRYLLNSILSLFIIYLIFLNRQLLRVSLLIFIIAFFVFTVALVVLLTFKNYFDYLPLFTVRRFLIHPLLLLILLPIFYFFIPKK